MPLQQSKTCRWVLGNGEYCNVPTRYKMVEDGGEPGAALIRKYEPFCPPHKERAEKMQAEEEG